MSFTIRYLFVHIGTGISGYWLNRTLKTVRRLVLKKGGKHVQIVTYGLFGPYNRYSTIPVQHVSRMLNTPKSMLKIFTKLNVDMACPNP